MPTDFKSIQLSVIDRQTLARFNQFVHFYPSRKAAFRAAKRDAKIPMRQSPAEVVGSKSAYWNSLGLDERYTRLYIFNIFVGAIAFEYHIREDKIAFYGNDGAGIQPPHFNAGEPPKKLKQHYFWQNGNGSKK